MAEHVCPWWLGRLLASPVRRLFQQPERILEPHLRENMRVLEPGCAMGFFSLPMARIVGPRGRVICVDLQPRMLDSLRGRAEKAGLAGRLEFRECDSKSLGIDDLAETIDFALAFAMVHEVPDPAALLSQVSRSLVAGGRLLLVEPRGHVRAEAFETTVALASATGLAVVERPAVFGSHSALLEKPRSA